MTAIRDHLNMLPGVPLTTLDPHGTNFYPDLNDDNTTIHNLEGNLTMVVCPEPLKGQCLTPSPFVDALQSAVYDVRDLKAQKSAASLIHEESLKGSIKPVDNEAFFRRFEAMEARFGRDIAELKQDNAELKRDNAELKRDNAKLKRDNAELSGRIDETMRAVLGDKVAINKVCWRVLLDMGRDRLAVICGHKDWRE